MAAELKELRIRVTARTYVWLDAKCRITGMDKAEIVREVLHDLASKEIRQAQILVALCEERGISIESHEMPGRPIKRQDERLIQAAIAADLNRCALNFETEVNAGEGIADVVVYGANSAPLGVIEVKVACRSWREVHQAAGQARAYADALSARICIVAAGEIAAKFIGERGGVTICRASDVAAFFQAGEAHVVSINERR